MSKFRIAITTIFIAVLAALGISMPAMAATVNEGATTPVPFTHTMHANPVTDLAGITYTINIAGTSADGTTGSYASTAVDVIGAPFTEGTITPATPSPAVRSDSTESTKIWADAETLAALFGDDDTTNTDADSGYPKFATNFPQAGIYKFTISETRAGADDTKWAYTPESNGAYTLTVWIENNQDDITKRHYDGWVLTDPSGTKVDVDATAGSEAGADFTSTYTATTSLNVTKQVVGEYASTTYAFPQEITLTLPDWAADADNITATGGQSGRWTVSTGVHRTYTVNLAHGETVTFSNLPVGTRYGVHETSQTDAAGLSYDAGIAWNVGEEGPIWSPATSKRYDTQPVVTTAASSKKYGTPTVTYYKISSYNNGESQLAAAPKDYGTYRVKVVWKKDGEQTYEKQADFEITKVPVTLSFGLYLDGEPFPDGGSVVYSYNLPYGRVTVNGLLGDDTIVVDESGSSLADTAHVKYTVRSDSDVDVDGYHGAYGVLISQYGGTNYYVVGDINNPEETQWAGGTIGSAGYNIVAKSIDESTAEGQTVSNVPYPTASEMLYDENLEEIASATNYDVVYYPAQQVESGTAGALELDGNYYVADVSQAESSTYPTTEGFYVAQVTGKNNYKGSRSIAFSVGATPLDSLDVSLVHPTVAFDGTNQMPEVVVKSTDGQTVYDSSSYRVSTATPSYWRGARVETSNFDFTEPGTYTLTVSGIGDLRGEKTLTYTVTLRSMDDVVFTPPYANSRGEYETSDFAARAYEDEDSYKFIYGRDFMVDGFSVDANSSVWKNWQDIKDDLATAEHLYVKVVPTGHSAHLTGSSVIECTFEVIPRVSINTSEFRLDAYDLEGNLLEWDGDMLQVPLLWDEIALPLFEIVDTETGELLDEGSDYNVFYSEEAEWEVGETYYVDIEGIGDYTGSKHIEYLVVPWTE